MARIFPIRHGDTQEKDGEIILSETGILEAKTVAKKLKQIPKYFQEQIYKPSRPTQ